MQWQPPINTCGINRSSMTYSLKVVQLEDSQTPEDAIEKNSAKLEINNINTNVYRIDTMLYQGVFQRGNTYVAQVKANSPSSEFSIENDGKTPTIVISFSKDTIPEKKKDDENNLKFFASEFDCGVELPSNLTPIDTLYIGDEVSIGKFRLKITQMSRNAETKLYNGEGIVIKPIVGDFQYFNWVNVVVSFDSLSVNSDKEVVSGFAKAMFEDNFDIKLVRFCTSFGEAPPDSLKESKAKSLKSKEATEKTIVDYVQNQETIKAVLSKFTGETKLTFQMFGVTAQKMPLRLQYNISGYNIDVAVSDMKFTPKGSTFSLLYLMKVPEVDQVIPFGLYNICMDGNPFQNGNFCLLQDVEIPLGKSNIKLLLKGGKDKTYVEWSNKEFRGVHLAADLIIPKEANIINAVDTSQPVKSSFTASIINWNDWIAEITVEKFRSAHVPDFVFEVKKAVFDHSQYKNPPELETAINQIAEEDPSYKRSGDNFTGLFIQEANMELPNYITGKKADKPVTLYVKNLLFEEEGFSAAIGVKDILKLETGNLGGWEFSIDDIGLLFVQGSFRKGSMNGKIKIPLNENDSYMTYECALAKPQNEAMKFMFSINPTIDYSFLKYFNAKLDPSSRIEIKSLENKKKERETIVSASFSGSLSVKTEKTTLPIVSFKELYLSNRNRKNEEDFTFEMGKWAIGGIDVLAIKGTEKKDKDEQSNNKTETKDPDEFKSQGHIGSFHFSVDGFKFETGEKKVINPAILKPKRSDALSSKMLARLHESNKEKDSSVFSKPMKIHLPIKIAFGGTDATMTGGGATQDMNFDLAYSFTKASAMIYNWDYKLSEISIFGKFGPVNMRGRLNIFDKDETFGDGFRGAVFCEFPMNLKAKATVQFGNVANKVKKTDTINYFYVDAAVMLGDAAALPIAGPIAVNGFGVGVWKNMVVKNENAKAKIPVIKDSTGKFESLDSTSIAQLNLNRLGDKGQGASGFEYVPVSDGNSFGMRGDLFLCATIAAGGSKLINGNVGLTTKFRNSAFESITLKGDIHAIGDGNSSLVNGNAEISYNHPERQFKLAIQVSANMMKSSIKETSSSSGEVDTTSKKTNMSVSVPFELWVDAKTKTKWFIGLGKPLYHYKDSTVTFDFTFNAGKKNSGLNLTLESTLQGYICGGNFIDYPMPPLPDELSKFLNISSSRIRKIEAPEKGFMFGARYRLLFDFEFGPLYAHLLSIIGFDIKMVDLSNNFCGDGREIRGIKGYYCTGQLFGYLEGDVGVQLKLFGSKKRFSLCSITAGAVLQGGLPNPSWFKGVAGVKGSILDGLIKFNTTARFSIGTECKQLSDPLKDFVVVESISPGEKSISNAKSINPTPSVFTSPKIACNIKLNQDFTLFTDDGTARKYKFAFKEVTFCEVNNQKNPLIIKNIADTSKKTNEFVLRPNGILKPYTTYMVKVQIMAREWRDNQYRLPWGDGQAYSEKEATQETIVYFTTGNMPDVIHPDNIRECYPMENQFETFVKNGKKGYMVLENNQQDIFDKREKNIGKEALYGEYINKTNKNQKPIKFYYDYVIRNINGTNRYVIEFDMKDLELSSVYQCKFYVVQQKQEDAQFVVKTKEEEMRISGSDVKTNQGLKSDTKLTEKGQKNRDSLSASDRDKFTVSLSNQSKTADQKNAIIKGIFAYHFRTSQYNSLEDKMSRLRVERKGKPFSLKNSPLKNYTIFSNLETDRFTENYSINWTNHKRSGGKGVEDIQLPLLYVYYPEYTTIEEVYGGKSINGSNAIDLPSMFQYEAELQYNPSSSNIEFLWETTCKDFLNTVKPGCDEFDLPYTRTQNLSLNTFRNSNNNLSNWYYKILSAKKDDFEGRLTTDEISNGIVKRRAVNDNAMIFLYTHISCVAYHLQYAACLADDLMDKGFVGKKIPKGFTKVSDNLEAGDKKSTLSSKIPGSEGCSLYYSYFDNTTDNRIKTALINHVNYYKSSKHANNRSNVEWLDDLWDRAWKQRKKDKMVYSELNDLRLGYHKIYITYKRVGESWLRIKTVNFDN